MDQLVAARAPRVFLVENSRLVRERLVAMLAGVAQFAGHAESAEEAIAAILETQPDVVVLDLMLTRGTGIDVLRALQHRAPGIGVYMLTNYPVSHYRRLAGELGALGFYDKTTEFNRVRDDIAAFASHVAH